MALRSRRGPPCRLQALWPLRLGRPTWDAWPGCREVAFRMGCWGPSPGRGHPWSFDEGHGRFVWNPRADSVSSEVGPQFGTAHWNFKAGSAVLAMWAGLASHTKLCADMGVQTCLPQSKAVPWSNSFLCQPSPLPSTSDFCSHQDIQPAPHTPPGEPQ